MITPYESWHESIHNTHYLQSCHALFPLKSCDNNMFLQREGLSIQPDWEMSPLEQTITFPWNIYKKSFQKHRQVCGGRLAISERPLVSPQRRAGGRAAPRPLALPAASWSADGRWSEPTPGGIADPPNQGLQASLGMTHPAGDPAGGRISIITVTMTKKHFYKWKKKAQR